MKKQALRPTGNSVLKRGLLLGIILLAHAPLTALGQELAAGDTIRLRPSQSTGTARGWSEGSVVRLAPDTLWYRSSGSVSAISTSLLNDYLDVPVCPTAVIPKPFDRTRRPVNALHQ